MADEVTAALVAVRTQIRNWHEPYRSALEIVCKAAERAVELERQVKHWRESSQMRLEVGELLKEENDRLCQRLNELESKNL